tara:strand:- start:5979 stop:6764 length:786 start_codon:yes stop_codon:yes gene_type:complete
VSKTAFIIFAHSTIQTPADVDDMIANISYFHKDCDFMVLHPNMQHPKVRVNAPVGTLNRSSFIFGPLSQLIKELTDEEVKGYDHFCLVSANQYFIDNITFKNKVNYVQYYNTDNWDNTYQGKDTDKTIVGFPLQQPYGKWDEKDLYKEYGIKIPMAGNWECMTLTTETMLLAKEHIDKCLEYYPVNDMINLFLPYMAIMSGQEWEFPPHLGTYDPANTRKNKMLAIDQVDELREAGYFSVKRVDYPRTCPVKYYIRENLMK